MHQAHKWYGDELTRPGVQDMVSIGKTRFSALLKDYDEMQRPYLLPTGEVHKLGRLLLSKQILNAPCWKGRKSLRMGASPSLAATTLPCVTDCGREASRALSPPSLAVPKV
jgi:hypothetical protein